MPDARPVDTKIRLAFKLLNVIPSLRFTLTLTFISPVAPQDCFIPSMKGVRRFSVSLVQAAIPGTWRQTEDNLVRDVYVSITLRSKERWVGCIALCMLISSIALAQGSWRHFTQDLALANPDFVAPQDKAARDFFFDKLIGADLPLDQSGNVPRIHSVWERVGPTPEVITSDDGVAVVGFSSFRCIASASKRSIYTEVSMTVEDVLKDTTGTLGRHESISVLLPGGKVKFASGKTVAWDINDNDYEIQPNGRYLIFLTHVKEGDFFLEDKRWLLNNGKAVANTVEDAIRSHQLTSKYSGLSENVFISSVRKQLNQSK